MRILAKNDRKCISLEPNIVWKRLVPFFELVSSQKNDNIFFLNLAIFWRFWLVVGNFLHLFTFWSIVVIISRNLVISEILKLFAIYGQFFTFFYLFCIFSPFGEYTFECILSNLNTFLAVSATVSATVYIFSQF